MWLLRLCALLCFVGSHVIVYDVALSERETIVYSTTLCAFGAGLLVADLWLSFCTALDRLDAEEAARQRRALEEKLQLGDVRSSEQTTMKDSL